MVLWGRLRKDKQVWRRYGRFLAVGLMLMAILMLLSPTQTQAAERQGLRRSDSGPESFLLSPMWGPTIHQWSTYIGVLAERHGLDPDFIAAVVQEESDTFLHCFPYSCRSFTILKALAKSNVNLFHYRL